MSWLTLFVSDQLWFCIAQTIITLLSALALLKVSVFTESSLVSAVHRGQESHNFVSGVASLFLTAIVAVIFSVSTFPVDGKVLMFLCDVILICYLCLWNGWSINKLIGWKVKFENRNFNPHRES